MHWCVGMYASGSTWLVHALRSTGTQLVAGPPHISQFVETAKELPLGWSTARTLIVKTHQIDETATILLLRAADNIWISVRDPRDCVTSLMLYMGQDFDTALSSVARSAWQCARVVDSGKGVLLRYEDRFFDDIATFDRLAAAFARPLPAATRDALFRETRREAIENTIRSVDPSETVDDGFPGHGVHIPTQWHNHHMNRTGEIGRWRRDLQPCQIVEVEQCLGAWMKRFDYSPASGDRLEPPN